MLNIVVKLAIVFSLATLFAVDILSANKFKEQHFIFLADSFLSGTAYFLEEPGSLGDTIYHQEKYYWSNPPFPAVVLMPVVAVWKLLGKTFYQGYAQFFVVLGVFLLVYKISLKLKYAKNDALFWALAFTFASAFIGVALWPWSWFFAHTLTVLLLFLAIWEFLGKKRYWLIGVLFGLIFLTRFAAVVGVVFFAMEIVLAKISVKMKLKNVVLLIFPILISIALVAYYNFIRFGNVTETGYFTNFIPDFLEKARSFGTFNPIHIPGNLYAAFLGTPLPVFKDGAFPVFTFPFVKSNPWGMSIFITSPYLVYLFFAKFKDKLSKKLLFTSLVIFLPALFYYTPGFRQYGYRYSLDFLPFLFWVLMHNYPGKKLSNRFKVLILVSAFINFYLFFTVFLSPT